MNKRDKLMIKGVALEKAANEKLMLPENRAKGGDWDQLTDLELLLMLDQEVTEFKEAVADLAKQAHFRSQGVPPTLNGWRLYRENIREEAGDVINKLRFICDKYDAI